MTNIDLTSNKVLSSSIYKGGSIFTELGIQNMFSLSLRSKVINNFQTKKILSRFNCDSTLFQSCDRCGKQFNYSVNIWWKYGGLCSNCEKELSEDLGIKSSKHNISIFNIKNDKLEAITNHDRIMRKIRLSY